MPTILDGRVARAELKKKLIDKVASLKAERGRVPTLAIIQVGDRPDTASYIRAKKSFGAEIGAEVRHIHLSEGASSDATISEIVRLNTDKSVDGIILQLPLPEALKADRSSIIAAIDPAKDADGLTASSIGKWSSAIPGQVSRDAIWPATARGVGELIDFYGVSLKNEKVCVIGRSGLVGTPIAALCRARGAIVTVCHSKTIDLVREASMADVIVSAVGKPKLVTVRHVKPGQVVVDVGINEAKGDGDAPVKLDEELPKRKLVGDVDFEAVKAILGDSGAITPVPGGVGPMTVLALFENLAELCDKM